jgi:hypothetical protein
VASRALTAGTRRRRRGVQAVCHQAAPGELVQREAGRWEPPCPACGRDLAPLAVTEDAVTDPRSVYAATKLHQEQLALVAMAAGGPVVTALRYHNVYGPRMPRDTPMPGSRPSSAAPWPPPWTAHHRRWSGAGDRATCATSSPPPAQAAERLGFRAEVGFAEGMTEFASAPLRAPARETR